MLFRVVLALGAILHFTIAQDLTVPKSWRKPDSSRSLNERINISRNAIDVIVSQLNHDQAVINGIGWWQTGSVMSAISNHDHLSGTTTYNDVVRNNINRAWQRFSNFDQYHTTMMRCEKPVMLFQESLDPKIRWWATAAVNAYRAYGDPMMLSYAVKTWDHVSDYVINSTGNSSKSFTLTRMCYNRSMVGGVFWRPTPDDENVNSITTSLYMTLSAYLAEITHNPKYTEAAISSARWIENLNLNADNIVLDTVNGKSCSRSPSTWLFTYNSGKFVEGLSILADVSGDPHWKQLMRIVIASATKSSAWQGSDGIITEGANSSQDNDSVEFKAIYVRGLCEVFLRNLKDINLDTLVHDYIDVQYNALLDIAATGYTFSANWHGPPTSFTTWGQMVALDVLVSAILVNLGL